MFNGTDNILQNISHIQSERWNILQNSFTVLNDIMTLQIFDTRMLLY